MPSEADAFDPDIERMRDAEKEAARERRQKARQELILEREAAERDQRATEARQRRKERDARLEQLIDR